MDMLSRSGRTCKSTRVRLLFLPALSAFVTLYVPKSKAEDNLEHPFIEQKEIKSETCLTCHPTKNEGRFVHSAVGMGCQNCHRAASENNKTTISFVAVGADLCAMCHEVKHAQVVHKPYHDGQCLICHNPHASEFRAQARATVGSLCLSCHGIGRPDVRVNGQAQTVSLLDGRAYDLMSFEQAPKVGGSHAQLSLQTPAGRAALAKGSKKPDAAPSCISCHDPHASDEKYLLHKRAASGGASGNSCYTLQSHRQCADEGQRNPGESPDLFPEVCA